MAKTRPAMNANDQSRTNCRNDSSLHTKKIQAKPTSRTPKSSLIRSSEPRQNTAPTMWPS